MQRNQECSKCNELHIDADKAIDSWFRPAYDWMVGQLEQRVKNYPRKKYPIWAWYHPKPGLRRSGHLPCGTSGVRIEFLVSSDRVLLSDFEAWHGVLNFDFFCYFFRWSRLYLNFFLISRLYSYSHFYHPPTYSKINFIRRIPYN